MENIASVPFTSKQNKMFKPDKNKNLQTLHTPKYQRDLANTKSNQSSQKKLNFGIIKNG